MQPSTCNLTGVFGICVQILLCVIFTAMCLYKRHIEVPRRRFIVFSLDISKQLISAFTIHCVNLLISKTVTHECSVYLLISTIDSAFGLVVNYALLKAVNILAEKLELNFMMSGNYFTEVNAIKDPNESALKDHKPEFKIDFSKWVFQSIIWAAIVLCSKLLLYVLEIRMSILINAIHSMLHFLGVTSKIFLVLVFFPAIQNCIMIWIQDNFLMKKASEFSEEEREQLYSYFYETEDLPEEESELSTQSPQN